MARSSTRLCVAEGCSHYAEWRHTECTKHRKLRYKNAKQQKAKTDYEAFLAQLAPDVAFLAQLAPDVSISDVSIPEPEPERPVAPRPLPEPLTLQPTIQATRTSKEEPLIDRVEAWDRRQAAGSSFLFREIAHELNIEVSSTLFYKQCPPISTCLKKNGWEKTGGRWIKRTKQTSESPQPEPPPAQPPLSKPAQPELSPTADFCRRMNEEYKRRREDADEVERFFSAFLRSKGLSEARIVRHVQTVKKIHCSGLPWETWLSERTDQDSCFAVSWWIKFLREGK